MEPNTLQVVWAAILVTFAVIVIVRYSLWSLADWWRLRPGKPRHEGCYGSGDTCNIKFISGDR